MAGIKAKQAAKAANDLSQAMTEPERQKRLPQNQRDPRNQAAKDILENLPRFLKNAKSLSEAPNKPLTKSTPILKPCQKTKSYLFK
jgi:hypothetical protein